MSKIKVIQYTGAMNRAGAETLLINIYRNIDREKFEFHFISHTREKCDYDDEIIELGGKILFIKRPSINNIKRYKNDFSRLIMENGPYNAIHTHMQLLNGLVLKESASNKIKNRISHAHLNGDYSKDSIFRNLYRLDSKRLINKYATRRLACSEKSGQYLYSGKKFDLINNAININDFCLNKKLDYMYKEFNLDKNIKLITHIGRFVEAKNHSFIIDVFKKIINQDESYRLMLVGHGEMAEIIKKKVIENGLDDYVLFLGLRSDINRILASTDIFFMPSLLEGLPVALVEAQAAGVPCIISNNIPKECDLGLGIVKQLDLSDDIEKWVQAITGFKKERIDFEIRKNKIMESGYGLLNNVQLLSELYSS